MGFSTSGSLLLVGLGLFIAIGTFHGAASDAMERVTDARTDQLTHFNRILETRINITSVSLTASCDVTITANNTGETTLQVNETDLLLDNTYRTGWRDDVTVSGDSSTRLWLPGESLTISETGLANAPNRVKLVTGPGVAGLTEVTDTC